MNWVQIHVWTSLQHWIFTYSWLKIWALWIHGFPNDFVYLQEIVVVTFNYSKDFMAQFLAFVVTLTFISSFYSWLEIAI